MLGLQALLALWIGMSSAVAADPAPRQAPPGGTVILVGFDGLRWDLVDRHPAPNFRRLIERGVRVSMKPRFPTITYVNFHALATGLHPERSGIVSNAMYDPGLDQAFGMRSWTDSRWWGGEPIWQTLQRQGGIAGVVSWVGAEAGDGARKPVYNMSYFPFAEDMSYGERLRATFRLLDLPARSRPSLITLYHDEVDVLSQIHGVDSAEEAAAFARHDALIGGLLDGLEQRGLLDQVHIVVVGDHGMADVRDGQTLYVDDFLEPGTYREDVLMFGAVLNVWPVGKSVEELERRLRSIGDGVSVYRREQIPARFHIAKHARTPPLLVVAKEGWKLCRRGDARCEGMRAIHGYDNALPSMLAAGMVSGPDIRRGTALEVVDNIDIYPLLAHLLGVQPAPNDANPCAFSKVLKRPPAGCDGAALKGMLQ